MKNLKYIASVIVICLSLFLSTNNSSVNTDYNVENIEVISSNDSVNALEKGFGLTTTVS